MDQAKHLKTILENLYRSCMAKYSNNSSTDISNNSDVLTYTKAEINDNATIDNVRHCPVRFDGYLCWPRTAPNTMVSQFCPDFVEGFNKNLLAHKTCLQNGTWYSHPESGLEWSNYTKCIDYDDLEFRMLINKLFVEGYALSLIALIASLCIFLGFRSLRCTRIRIHVHLFSSLALTCFLWILWYKLVIEQPENIQKNSKWCIGLHLLVHYSMLVNYFWMFCEGLHLHLVLVVVFIKETIVMRWFLTIGWLLPIPIVIIYAVARYNHSTDSIHCWMEESDLMWIFTVPICVSLLATLIFLANVLQVIIRKLHPKSAKPASIPIKKAVRATIILTPLFGLQYFLLPYRPENGEQLEKFYQIISVIFVSLQGLCVSCLFCFINHEVIYVMRKFLNRIMPLLVAGPIAAPKTIQIPTTTANSKEVEI